jgi:phosphohistidine swiveling domain-containing protein/DNA-binding Xre family transcriptional regulator
MIKLKLKSLAKKLNKNISEISNETGISRNAITALYHNKVYGIKFDTIEKLSKTYNLELEDILEINFPKKFEKEKIYIQEGEIVPFNIWPGLLSINNMPQDYFGQGFGKMYAYAKDNYLIGFWDENAMNKVAQWSYEKYYKKNQLDKLYKIFLNHAQNLENLYFNCNPQAILFMNNDEIATYFGQIWHTYQKFWQYSVFIDSFDPGFDQKKIDEIALQNKLTKEDVVILTTPVEMTFNNERTFLLLEIIKKIKKKKIKFKNLDKFLENFVETDLQIKDYKIKFDYYKSNYASVEHITKNEIIKEVKKYLLDKNLMNVEYLRLKKYSKNQAKLIEKILKKNRLKENPLYFFNRLTFWREYRKKVNLMGFHILDAILNSIEAKIGISKKYLQFLIFEEVDRALKGFIGLDILKKRREDGLMVIFEEKSYKMLIGKEAESLKNEMFQKVEVKKEIQKTFSGQVASRGYAKGIAKIVLDKKDFGKINEGDILVTSMTRPEFLPVIKKATGIITNEGGITCHAAIISRELGKPCIIGTKIATQLIKDGDVVEVRANHGTIRILS